ncbi:hypothetical protein ACQ4WP_02400 [Janthinobacterium sp. GB4P2]
MQRYGQVCHHAGGATLFEAGSSSFGMLVIRRAMSPSRATQAWAVPR